jgi:hypothetical protein
LIAEEEMTMHSIKGMVQVAGVTYRIVRLVPYSYEVVRIIDDRVIGHFHLAPELRVVAENGGAATLYEIAQNAIRTGITSWQALHAVRPAAEPFALQRRER